MERAQPPQLFDQAINTLIKHFSKTCNSWTRRLYSAAGVGRQNWIQEIDVVRQLCRDFRNVYSELPVFIHKMIAHTILARVIENIVLYNYYHTISWRGWWFTQYVDNELHRDICKCMLRSVLIPCLYTMNIDSISSQFVAELICESLHLFSIRLVKLTFPHNLHVKYTHLLINAISTMTDLEEFDFEYNCTNEVIKELVKYCSEKLTHLNIHYSVLVNDIVVYDLLELKNLVSLEVKGTSISDFGYATILSNMHSVENISWSSCIDSVLFLVSKYSLPKIKKFSGILVETHLFTLMLPNVKQLYIRECKTDISGILPLPIEILTMNNCNSDYVQNVPRIIRGVGRTLTRLNLESTDVDINDIIQNCVVLQTLSFYYCELLVSDHGVFVTQLPHFTNLKHLKLERTIQSFNLNSLITCYVNLILFEAKRIPEIDDDSIESIYGNGGFANLEEFRVRNCGYMSIATFWTLIRMSPKLNMIATIRKWRGMRKVDIDWVNTYVRGLNLACKVY